MGHIDLFHAVWPKGLYGKFIEIKPEVNFIMFNSHELKSVLVIHFDVPTMVTKTNGIEFCSEQVSKKISYLFVVLYLFR